MICLVHDGSCGICRQQLDRLMVVNSDFAAGHDVLASGIALVSPFGNAFGLAQRGVVNRYGIAMLPQTVFRAGAFHAQRYA